MKDGYKLVMTSHLDLWPEDVRCPSVTVVGEVRSLTALIINTTEANWLVICIPTCRKKWNLKNFVLHDGVSLRFNCLPAHLSYNPSSPMKEFFPKNKKRLN